MHSMVRIIGAGLIVAFGTALGCSSSTQQPAGAGGSGAEPSGGAGLIPNFGGSPTFGGSSVGGAAATGGTPTAGTGGTPTAGTGGIPTAGTGGAVTAGTGGGTASGGCKGTAAACTTSVDCCSLSCVGGTCAPMCGSDGSMCTD